jgi:predicted SprT family Zn-dependent metalloprotease
MMTKQDAENIVHELIRQHKLDGWTFGWMRRRDPFRRAGQCDWGKKRISLQPVYVELNDARLVMNTILHEIAHALTPRHGHNKYWKAKAREIGCTGARCYPRETINSSKKII